MKTIKDSLYTITVPTPYAVGDVHLYVLKGERITLIDAGVRSDEAWEAFRSQLAGYDLRPEDISQVILTHHHPDHVGLVEYLPNVKQCLAHRAAFPWIDRDERFTSRYVSFFEEFYRKNGVPEALIDKLGEAPEKLKEFPVFTLTGTLKEGETIPGHSDWEVIETPGHAQSHISLFSKEDGVMIGGDHLLYHISPNPIIEPPFHGNERTRPLIQYRDSLKKLFRYNVKEVMPGHGPRFNNAEEIIRKRLSQQEERADKVYSIIEDQPSHSFDISRKLFPRQYKKQYPLTMSETVGQLDFLEERGKIYRERSKGVDFYFISEES
ncbi:MBL fold metallo-hydrolase [Salimicrobium jeotgali]|uniref:MBL fold metallo-hydrolase n=1 Tax=Salimicrobium jeotgali TaxID=1230341 RepID=UPI000C845004|nr:MBL fold metallo-hydrolase [Salimicrobium jeotgali]